MRYALLAGALAVVSAASSPAIAQGASEGEQVFKKCMACHRVGEGAKNSVGPVLSGVVGRVAGKADGYSYSELNKAAGAAGLVWSKENIVTYLADPNAFLKGFLESKGQGDKASGSTKMPFKLPSEEERKSVAAYLATFSK